MRDDELAVPEPPSEELLTALRVLPLKGSGAVADFLEQRHRRQLERVVFLLNVAAGDLDENVEVLIGRIQSNERLSDLLHNALRAAAASGLEAKRRALGKALASGVLAQDDATIDESELLVSALSNIEAPHVRVLAAMVVEHGVSISSARKRARNVLGQESEETTEAILQQLSAWGLAESDHLDITERIADSGSAGFRRLSSFKGDFARTWSITQFGLSVYLMLVEDEVETEPDTP
jgi:hypothetical protein